MAITIPSSTYLKNAVYRPTSQTEAEQVTVTVTVPAGVTVGVGDILKFCRLGDSVRVNQFQLVPDVFDSNATAACAGKLGITASDACLLATGTVVNTNAGVAKVFAKFDGEATAIDSFAVTPFPVQTSIQELIFTFTAAATTAVLTDRKMTLTFDFQYAYPDTYISGLTGITNAAPSGLGTYATSNALNYTYNNQAP